MSVLDLLGKIGSIVLRSLKQTELQPIKGAQNPDTQSTPVKADEPADRKLVSTLLAKLEEIVDGIDDFNSLEDETSRAVDNLTTLKQCFYEYLHKIQNTIQNFLGMIHGVLSGLPDWAVGPHTIL